jgi:hypothetical protein
MRPLLRLVAKATVQRIARDILSLALALAPALALAHSGEMKPQFDHEKLNVYQASLEFMTWATELVSKLDPELQSKIGSIAPLQASRSISLKETGSSPSKTVAGFSILLAAQH